jgi:hypothetical protein
MQVLPRICTASLRFVFAFYKQQDVSLGFGRGKDRKFCGGGGREKPEQLPRGFHDTKFPSFPLKTGDAMSPFRGACARTDRAVASGEVSTNFVRMVGRRPMNGSDLHDTRVCGSYALRARIPNI